MKTVEKSKTILASRNENSADPRENDRAARLRRVKRKPFHIGYMPMQADHDTPKETYENKDDVGGGYNRWTGY